MTSRVVPGQFRRLTLEDFRLLRDVIYEHAGLVYDESAMMLFDRRLSERLEALGLPSYHAYYKYLRFDARNQQEIEEAVERLTTKETYFFRQEYQLRAFQSELLPRLQQVNASSRRLLVWSAGCSTGEEVYTLAALILESGRFEGWDVRVIGSDLSKQCVAHARRGVYQAGALRATSARDKARYFYELDSGFHVVDSIKKLCQFGQMNLFDVGRGNLVGRVDAIFCRNVLIYFDVRSRKRVIDNLYQRLIPGGYLMLGHSESLLNLSTAFELVHLRDDLVYRKPVGAERMGGL
ncbi:MAG TPA: protein-glutamate O-methyltransferase CheR [Polyangiaceae bacterium]|nr:protein-glutamate O-methyltransferase CheR [Polyangiaceae bacterium]